MVQLYCSEQIAIPYNLPKTLKTYAKAAIKTQPCDVLAWSAAYFRCLANDQLPPAKCRLEKPCHYKCLTRGYIRALINLLGKGYFVSRCLLQKRWEELCLPEDELFKFLSLCRMLNWPQIHWLKVLAAMIGSLNCSLDDTVVMICELLTDCPDGGPAYIPFWMFKICYTFVANLDCSQEMCFVNGCKVRPYGDLEDAPEMTTLPRILSASLLKDTIISRCKMHAMDPHQCKDTGGDNSSGISTPHFSNIKLTTSGDLLEKCDNFDALLLLINDQCACNQMKESSNCSWPHSIFQKQLVVAKEQEDVNIAKRNWQAKIAARGNETIVQKEGLQAIRDIGPPWTWFYQFTENNCDNASYNFIEIDKLARGNSECSEDDQSKSALSFDMIKEQQLVVPKVSKGGQLEIEMPTITPAVSNYSLEQYNLDEGGGNFQEDDLKKGLTNFMQKNEKSGTKNVEDITESITQMPAPPDPAVTSMKNLIGYLNNVVPCSEARSEVASEMVSAKSKSVENLQQTADNVSATMPEEVEETEENEENVEDLTEGNIAAVFQKSGVTEDKSLLSQPMPTDVILGLADHLPQPVEEVHVSEVSEISCSGSLTGDGNRSDDSSIFDLTPKKGLQLGSIDCCRDYVPQNLEKPLTFKCSIPPIPGIGPRVSQETIKKFLLYLKFRARNQHGLIKPANFKEKPCPYMTDTETSACPEDLL